MAQYDFLKEITNNHYPIKTERKPIAGEYAFPDPFVISADGAGEVTLTALNDFADFLNVAFGIKTVVKNGKGNLNCLDKRKKTEKIRIINKCYIDNRISVLRFCNDSIIINMIK